MTVVCLDMSMNYLCLRPHSFVVRLVAIVASGQVSDSGDAEVTTFGGIRVFLATVVTKTLKQAADHILVVADKVGVLADVVAIPDGRGAVTAHIYVLRT